MGMGRQQLLAAAAAAALLAACLVRPGPLARAALWVQSPALAARAALQTATQPLTGQGEALPAGAVPDSPRDDGTGDTGELPAPQAADAPAAAPDIPYVTLLGDDRRPADAGTIKEQTYAQGSGDNYIPLSAGSIRNNTRLSAAEVARAAAAGLPFAIEPDSTQPQVLIMHTHATESYRLSEGLWYDPADTFRSTDRAVDMCAVGAVMADTLNAAGICTLQDTTLNDYPSYTGSYDNSRAVVRQYLEQYPSIKVVLDVHRDAIEADGSPVAPVVTINGRKAAQVMIISGCDNGGSVRLPDHQKNLGFAAAWEAKMEAMYPGLTRPVLFSYRFYNQDLTTGSLLIEIGGHGNSLNEALYSGYLVATALAELLAG